MREPPFKHHAEVRKLDAHGATRWAVQRLHSQGRKRVDACQLIVSDQSSELSDLAEAQ